MKNKLRFADVFTTVNTKLNEREIIMIDIQNLIPIKKEKELEDVYPLTKDIETYGLLTPLSVVGPYKNGKYKIVNGNRRYYALISMIKQEMRTVPVYIVEDKQNDITCRELYLASNMANADKKSSYMLEYVELVYAEYNGYIPLKEKKILFDTCSNLMGISDRYVREAERVVRECDDTVKKAVKSGVIDIIEADKIAKESKKTSIPQQEYMDSIRNKPAKVSATKAIEITSKIDDVDDRKAVMKAITKTPKNIPLETILHVVHSTPDEKKQIRILKDISESQKSLSKGDNKDYLTLINAFVDVMTDRFNLDYDTRIDILTDVVNRVPESIQIQILSILKPENKSE